MAHDSQGTVFYISSVEGSPSTWLAVDGVTSIRDLRSGTGAEIDITDLSSTAKEFSLGLKDEGSMTLDVIINTSDLGQRRLLTVRDTRELANFQIIIPAGSPNYTLLFSGRVTTFPFTAAVDDVLRGTVTIRVSGTIIET